MLVLSIVEADENGGTMQRAMSLYDYVMVKYADYTDGIDPLYRFPNGISSSNTNKLETNSAAIVIVTIGCIAAAGIGFILFKKKKEN